MYFKFSLSLTKSTVQKFDEFCTAVTAPFKDVVVEAPFQHTLQLCSDSILDMVHDQLYQLFLNSLRKVDQGNWFKCWFYVCVFVFF